jgi:hypothetical protein
MNMNSVFVIIALAILIWFAALLYLKAFIRRRTTADYMLGQLREEIRLLEAGIDEKTEQNLLLLEEKIQALRDVCGEAEKRVALYTQELRRKTVQDTALKALHKSPSAFAAGREAAISREAADGGKARRPARRKNPAGPSRKGNLIDSLEVLELNRVRAASAYKDQAILPEAVRDKPRPVEPDQSVPAGKIPAKTGESVDAAPSAFTTPEETPAGPRFVRSDNPIIPRTAPMRERVAELYKAGFSEELIAGRLGISVSEARLFIAMHTGI